MKDRKKETGYQKIIKRRLCKVVLREEFHRILIMSIESLVFRCRGTYCACVSFVLTKTKAEICSKWKRLRGGKKEKQMGKEDPQKHNYEKKIQTYIYHFLQNLFFAAITLCNFLCSSFF